MSEAEMQRKMEFIVETLASVTTKIDTLTERTDKLAEAQGKDTARVAQLETSFVMLTELARSADERANRTEYRVAGLEEAYVNIAKMVERIEGEQHSGNSL